MLLGQNGAGAVLGLALLGAGLARRRTSRPGRHAHRHRPAGAVILTAALNTAAPTGVVSGNIFDGLVDYDTDLNPVPVLAESWETRRTASRSP